jgi:hypothetical protein
MGTVWGNGVVFWSLEQMPVSRNRCMFFVIALCPVLYHFEFKDTGTVKWGNIVTFLTFNEFFLNNS